MYKRKIEPEKKIKAYQREEGSAREIMKRLKISKASFQKWVRNYNTFGRNGLLDKAKAKHYPKEVAHPLFIEASCRLHKENQNPIL